MARLAGAILATGAEIQRGNEIARSSYGNPYQSWTMGRGVVPLPRLAEVFHTDAFGPSAPIMPMGVDSPKEGDERAEPRRFQYPVAWNMPVAQPGSEGLGKLVAFSNLRAMADLYSVVRSCIEIRKQEVLGIAWDIVPTDEAEKEMRQQGEAVYDDWQRRKNEVMDFFRRPDRTYHNYKGWLSAFLEDHFVIDAATLWLAPSRTKGKGVVGSDLAAIELVDGVTIRPLLDIRGSTPMPPNPAYQQYLYGVPRTDMMDVITGADVAEIEEANAKLADFRGDQMLYLPYLRRSWTPYGFPGIERALLPAITGLRRQAWALEFFTEGSVPGMFVVAGDEISTPSQVAALQAALNAMAGDMGMKHKIVVLPHGSSTEPQKSPELAQIFDELLMHQVLMAYEVMPSELGLAPKVSTLGATQATSRHDQQTHERKGLVPLMGWLKDSIFDFILHEVLGQGDMEWSWVGMEEPDDQEKITNDWKTKVSVGRASIDEWRISDGEDPWGLPETSTPGIITAQGYIPLGQLQPEEPGILQEEEEEGKDVSGTPPAPQGGGGPAPDSAAADATPKPGAAPRTTGVAQEQERAKNMPKDVGTGGPGAEADKPKRPQRKHVEAEIEKLRRYLRNGRSLAEYRSDVIPYQAIMRAAVSADPVADRAGFIRAVRKAVATVENAPERHLETARRVKRVDLQKRRRQDLDDAVAAAMGVLVAEIGGAAMQLNEQEITPVQFQATLGEIASQSSFHWINKGTTDAISDIFAHYGRDVEQDLGIEDRAALLSKAEGLLGNRALISEQTLMKLTHDAMRGVARMGTQPLQGDEFKAAMQNRLESTAASIIDPTYQEAYATTVNAFFPEAQLVWHTKQDPICCDLCQERDGVTYDAPGSNGPNELPGYPGDGDFGELCEGGPRCRCWLDFMLPTSTEELSLQLHVTADVGKYDDSEPRDDHGRWAGDGESVSQRLSRLADEKTAARAEYEAAKEESIQQHREALKEEERAESGKLTRTAAQRTNAASSRAIMYPSPRLVEATVAMYRADNAYAEAQGQQPPWSDEAIQRAREPYAPKFSVDQLRDHLGRWTSGGGDESKTADEARAEGADHGRAFASHPSLLERIKGFLDQGMYLSAQQEAYADGVRSTLTPGLSKSKKKTLTDADIKRLGGVTVVCPGQPSKATKYSEDEPRDAHGKWTTGGGGAPLSSEGGATFGQSDTLRAFDRLMSPTQQKVYDAENQVRNMDGSGKHFPTLEDAQAHSTDLYRQLGGDGVPPAVFPNSSDPDTSATTYFPPSYEQANENGGHFASQDDYAQHLASWGLQPGQAAIRLGGNMMDQMTVDHEMAHVFTADQMGGTGGHGEAWQAEYTSIMERDGLGAQAADFQRLMDVPKSVEADVGKSADDLAAANYRLADSQALSCAACKWFGNKRCFMFDVPVLPSFTCDDFEDGDGGGPPSGVPFDGGGDGRLPVGDTSGWEPAPPVTSEANTSKPMPRWIGRAKKYSESQPRDDHGRWTTGGDSGEHGMFDASSERTAITKLPPLYAHNVPGIADGQPFSYTKAAIADRYGEDAAKDMTPMQARVYDTEQMAGEQYGRGESYPQQAEAQDHADEVWKMAGGIGPPPKVYGNDTPDMSYSTFDGKFPGLGQPLDNARIAIGSDQRDQMSIDHEVAHLIAYQTVPGYDNAPFGGHTPAWQQIETSIYRQDGMPKQADFIDTHMGYSTSKALPDVSVADLVGKVALPDDLKFNPDQPRDYHGRWLGEGEGGGFESPTDEHIIDYQGTRPLDEKGHLESVQGLDPGTRQVGYAEAPWFDTVNQLQGTPNPDQTDPEAYEAARNALFDKQPVEQVPVHDVTFTQPNVNADAIAHLESGKDSFEDKPAYVVRYGSEDYVVDGHHRFAAAADEGRATYPAHVLNLDQMGLGPSKLAMPDDFKYSADQARDDHGRWTSGGGAGGDTSTGGQSATSSISPTEFADLGMKELGDNGGYSLDATGQPPETERYVSSVAGYERSIPEVIQPNDLASYYHDNLATVQASGGKLFFGGWHDTEGPGTFYLDLSTSLADREQALRFGGQNGQLAIWDAHDQVAIPVPEEYRMSAKAAKVEKGQHWLSKLSPGKRERAMREMYAKVRPKRAS